MVLTKKAGELAAACLPASDFCLVASGDTVFAGGEQIELTRREASEWAQRDEL